MKNVSRLFAGFAVAGLLAAGLTTFAAESKGKDTTISGEAKCAKCALKETKKCQTVIQAQEGGKTVTYYLVDNKVAKDFHKNVCEDAKKVTATGTVKDVGTKHEFVASKIELAK